MATQTTARHSHSSTLVSALTAEAETQTITVTEATPLTILRTKHRPKAPSNPQRPPQTRCKYVTTSTTEPELKLPLTQATPAKPERRVHTPTLCIVYALTLIAEASRGLLLPTIWPLLRAHGGQKHMLGIVMAAFSLGRALCALPLGCLSDRVRTAHLMTACACLQMAGHLLYALAGTPATLTAARFLVGAGSAASSLGRSHLAISIPPRHRTPHFAYLSALQFAGVAVMPGIGGLLSGLPAVRLGVISLNAFTYPAYLLVACNAFCVLFVQTVYREPCASPASQIVRPCESQPLSAKHDRSNDCVIRYDGATDYSSPCTASADVCALVVCVVVNVVLKGVLAELETVSIPFLMEEYTLTSGLASAMLSAMGCVGVVIYLLVGRLARWCADRTLLVTGVCVIAAGTLPLTMRCLVSRIPVGVYVGLMALTWSIGYPVGQTVVLSLFSKLLVGLPVGGLLGLFSASGSLAPLLLAVVATSLWNEFGREYVFASILALALTALGIASLYYRRLLPPSTIL